MSIRLFKSPLLWLLLVAVGGVAQAPAVWAADAPVPLPKAGHPVDWWFVFKLNAKAFPGGGEGVTRVCPFGGAAQSYKEFGQQFVYASSENPELQPGGGCAGETTADPLGATFDQVYADLPGAIPKGCWRGMTTGGGFVLQVSTPS